jgi:hypothetical protein
MVRVLAHGTWLIWNTATGQRAASSLDSPRILVGFVLHHTSLCTSTPVWLSVGLRTSQRLSSPSLLECSCWAMRFRLHPLLPLHTVNVICLKSKPLMAITTSSLTQLILLCTLKSFPDSLRCFIVVIGIARVPTQEFHRTRQCQCI